MKEFRISQIMSGMIPAIVLSDKTLTQTSKLLYGIIHGFSFNGLTCFAVNERLGEALGVSARTISDAISLLLAKDLIFVKTNSRTSQREISVTSLTLSPAKIGGVAENCEGSRKLQERVAEN
jgi:hypothetical protein